VTFRWPMDDISRRLPSITATRRKRFSTVHSLEIALELCELAVRFGRMAANAGERKLSEDAVWKWPNDTAPRLPFPIGVSGSSVRGCGSHETNMVLRASGADAKKPRWGKPGFHNRTIGSGENPLDRPNPQTARASMGFRFSTLRAAIGHRDRRC
jgi:hypothetical protein